MSCIVIHCNSTSSSQISLDEAGLFISLLINKETQSTITSSIRGDRNNVNFAAVLFALPENFKAEVCNFFKVKVFSHIPTQYEETPLKACPHQG